MTHIQEVGRRMVLAHVRLMSKTGETITVKELAKLTSKAHPSRTFTGGQVGEYQKGQVGQPFDFLVAYGKATDVDPGWLAFGSASQAPAPSGLTAEPSGAPPTHPHLEPYRTAPREPSAAKPGKPRKKRA